MDKEKIDNKIKNVEDKYKIALRYISTLKLILSRKRPNIKEIDKEITEMLKEETKND